VVLAGREGGRKGGLCEELALTPAQVSELTVVLCEGQKEGGGGGKTDEKRERKKKEKREEQHGNDEEEGEEEEGDDFGLAAVETSLARLRMCVPAAAAAAAAAAATASSSSSVFPRANEALMALEELLEPEQQSRYLEWADANREAIAGLSLGGGGREGGKEGGKNGRFHFFSSTENPFVSKKKFLLPASVSSFFDGGPGASK
jgi:hypothetical protein